MQLAASRRAASAASSAARAPAAGGVVARRHASTTSRAVPVELLAAAGDVDAPLIVPIAAALVVTAVVTAVVPAYLNRGQQAADQIFASKQKAPLDKKKPAKTGKGAAKRR